MNLSDIINMSRVEIIDQNEDSYHVKHDGIEYQIAKSNETSFTAPSSSGSMSMDLSLKHLTATHIKQDEAVPELFLEPMMLHEIREMQYLDLGFSRDESHKKAVNDEVLYALKFFDKREQNAYFQFAEDYRIESIEIIETQSYRLLDICVELSHYHPQKNIWRSQAHDVSGLRSINSPEQFLDAMFGKYDVVNDYSSEQRNRLDKNVRRVFDEVIKNYVMPFLEESNRTLDPQLELP